LPAKLFSRYTACEYQAQERLCVEAVNIKEEARRLIEKLPDDATWDDVMREIYAQQTTEITHADNSLSQRKEAVRKIDALREQLFAKYGEMPDSVELLREDRAR
jgi:lipase chaperone LimK